MIRGDKSIPRTIDARPDIIASGASRAWSIATAPRSRKLAAIAVNSKAHGEQLPETD